ncbi:MAG: metal-dependent hydrolase [Methylococcaceae bacterium]|nr:metal-dependent hydrolase [Methylococcaceae bacterium]
MPTLIGHLAAPLGIGLGLGSRTVPRRVLASGMVLALLPDLDVLAFRFGIPYNSPFGHRGFSHSLVFAAIAALAFTLLIGAARRRPLASFLFLFVSAASHALLDAVTDGGLGVALLWPFSNERYFAPFRAIEVSPLGLSRFFSDRGLAVLRSELLWVWLPLSGLGLWLYAVRRMRTAWIR